MYLPLSREAFQTENKILTVKTFEYHLGDKVLSIRLDEKQGTIAELLIDGAHPEVSEADMQTYAAVIALALIEYEVEVVHDDEPGVITVTPVASNWNAPTSLINPLPLV